MRLIRHAATAVNGFELSKILAIGRRTVAVAVPLLLENINRCRRVCTEPIIQCALAVRPRTDSFASQMFCLVCLLRV